MSDEAKAPPLDDDDPAPEAASEVAKAVPASGTASDFLSEQRVALLRKVVPAAWAVAVLVAGYVSGIELGFLVAAAGVLTLVITLMWSSVQSLTGGASIGFEEALGMGAPSKVEEQKRAVLRALNDLKFELGVGKISKADFDELSAKYREDAKRLMQTLDEKLDPAREQVEQSLKLRLATAGLNDMAANPEKLPENPEKSAPNQEDES